MTTRSGEPQAAAVVDAFPYLAGALLASPFLLLVPASWGLTWRLIVHLSLLVALGIAVAVVLAPRLAEPFFSEREWPERRKVFAGGVVLVVLVTGLVGLATLASAAALRFDVSLQFLQLLSALDISWAAAAIVIGAHHRWGRVASLGGGVVLGVVCVFSIWNYVSVVGYTAAGGWLVDGSKLMTLVIPFDMMAAVIAVAVLLAGVRVVSADRTGE